METCAFLQAWHIFHWFVNTSITRNFSFTCYAGPWFLHVCRNVYLNFLNLLPSIWLHCIVWEIHCSLDLLLMDSCFLIFTHKNSVCIHAR